MFSLRPLHNGVAVHKEKVAGIDGGATRLSQEIHVRCCCVVWLVGWLVVVVFLCVSVYSPSLFLPLVRVTPATSLSSDQSVLKA
eukprot:gene3790-2680_t